VGIIRYDSRGIFCKIGIKTTARKKTRDLVYNDLVKLQYSDVTNTTVYRYAKHD